ncbi:MAG: hypothetical protein ACJ8GN_24860 [Longimicrobiaceae bacterium]
MTATIADLRALPSPISQVTEDVLGYYAANDGGGGTYLWDAASTEADNQGTVIVPDDTTPPDPGRWKLMYSGRAVRAEQFGLKGDYDPANGSGDPETALLQTALAAVTILDLGGIGRRYRVTDLLDVTDRTLISRGAEIHRTDDAAEMVLQAVGTVGSYFNLSANAEEDRNVVVCSGIVGQLRSGDLVKIISNKLFVADGEMKQGEMALVASVDGSNIYLSGRLHDTYLTADTARIARVAPASFRVEGWLSVYRWPSTDTTATYGVELRYVLRPRGDLRLYNCTRTGLAVNSCYAPEIDVLIVNSYYRTSTSSYGIAIGDSTMAGRFRGVVMGARHAVTAGGAPAYGGVSWDNTVSVIAQGAASNAMFDAHPETGSIFYENCIALGGVIDNGTGTTARPNGFVLGARFSHVKDVVCIGCASGISTRGRDVREFVVDGLHLSGCTIHGFNSNDDTHIGRLVVRNVTGTSASQASTYAVAIQNGQVDAWEFSDLTLDVGGIISVGGTDSTPPVLRVHNARAGDTAIPTSTVDTSWRGVNIASASIDEVWLEGAVITNRSVGISIASAVSLAELRLVDVRMDSAYEHVRVQGSVERVWIDGGSFRNSKHGVSTYGMVNFVNAATVSTLYVAGAFLDSDPYVVGRLGTTTNLLHGQNQFHSGFVGLSRLLSTGWIEVVGGSLNAPRVLRGNGSPENAVTAPVGTHYQRADGGAGTTFYVKESGTGNTGWVAK